MHAASYEQPMLCVLDAHDRDKLLERLREVHGPEGRRDIAPELMRATARQQARASEQVPISG